MAGICDGASLGQSAAGWGEDGGDGVKRAGIGSHTKPNVGGSVEWFTPPEIIAVLGRFDDDPCRPGATDGLSRKWNGRVWLNPPYDRKLHNWLWKLADHGNGIALLFARTETRSFVECVWQRATALLFLHGRLHFHRADGSRADGNAGGPSVLVAYGENNADALSRSRIRGTLIRQWFQRP